MPPKTRSSSSTVLKQAGKVASDFFGLKSPNTSTSSSHTEQFSSAKSDSDWGGDELNLSQEDIDNLDNNMGDKGGSPDTRKRQASTSPPGGVHRQDMVLLNEIRSLKLELTLIKTWQNSHEEIIKANVEAVANAVSLLKDTQNTLSQFMVEVAEENVHLRESVRLLEENYQKMEAAGVEKITNDAKQTLSQLENIQASIKEQIQRGALSAVAPGGGT
jgi:hypothetical protein